MKLKTLKDMEIEFKRQFESDNSERKLVWIDMLKKKQLNG